MTRKSLSIVLVISVILLYALGFRVSHPQSGLGTSLGSASSSIVIIKESGVYSVGEKVVAQSASAELSPVLGEVTAVADSVYSVSNGVFLESIDGDEVRGRMIFIVPFLGHLFGLIGL